MELPSVNITPDFSKDMSQLHLGPTSQVNLTAMVPGYLALHDFT